MEELSVELMDRSWYPPTCSFYSWECKVLSLKSRVRSKNHITFDKTWGVSQNKRRKLNDNCIKTQLQGLTQWATTVGWTWHFWCSENLSAQITRKQTWTTVSPPLLGLDTSSFHLYILLVHIYLTVVELMRGMIDHRLSHNLSAIISTSFNCKLIASIPNSSVQ